jgi:hypothetical protein
MHEVGKHLSAFKNKCVIPLLWGMLFNVKAIQYSSESHQGETKILEFDF